MKKIPVLLMLLTFLGKADAQEIKATGNIEEKVENIAETRENEDLDYSNLLEIFSFYYENPLNLNSTSKEELLQLQLLDEMQINNLLDHIENNGRLINIYELQSIAGFDIPTIKKILPFVKVKDIFESPYFTPSEMLQNGKHQVVTRYQRILEKEKGYEDISAADNKANPNSRYLGNENKLFMQYRFTYSKYVSWGIIGEKDAGEEFFKGTQQKGFDFYSCHLYIKPNRFIKNLAIGDYSMSFGQGLTAWSGLTFGKSSDVINIKKNAKGISPYASVDENLFMRGGAVTFGLKKIETTVFYSLKKIDASILLKDSLTNEVFTVSSLQETGFHTTLSEIESKHSLQQTISGGNISYKTRKFSVGITSIHRNFGAMINKNLSLYNQFEFNGKKLTNIGADYNIVLKNMNLFGEAAICNTGGIAYLTGILLNLDPKISFSLLQRNYQRNYQSLSSSGFSENTNSVNEHGIYAGVIIKPVTSVTISGYYDRFTFPWLKYRVNAPSSGSDYLTQINYTPSKKLDMYFRIRRHNKFMNADTDNSIDFIVPEIQANYRYNISYAVTPSIKIKNRVEYISYRNSSKTNENGFVVYQDIVYKPLGKKVSGSLRYALFQTDSYNSRVYAYENDVPGSYSIPAYYDTGSRFYVLADYNISRNIEIWLRYSQTYYSNKKIISEGSLTEILGPSKSEIKAQVKVIF